MFEIGVMVNNLERDRLVGFAAAKAHGFQVIHTNALAESWLIGPERERYVDAAKASGLTIAAMFIGFDGQDYSNPHTILHTVGLGPMETRAHRLRAAQAYLPLARELGAPAVALHAGLPPDTGSRLQVQEFHAALRELADQCADARLDICFETGQEPARGMLELVEGVDRPNVGVNFDAGNFVLYGTEEPLQALACLKAHVRGVHCKDGLWPTSPDRLGQEVALGNGVVNYRLLLEELRAIEYRGPLILEREQGPSAVQDILAGRALLKSLI